LEVESHGQMSWPRHPGKKQQQKNEKTKLEEHWSVLRTEQWHAEERGKFEEGPLCHLAKPR